MPDGPITLPECDTSVIERGPYTWTLFAFVTEPSERAKQAMIDHGLYYRTKPDPTPYTWAAEGGDWTRERLLAWLNAGPPKLEVGGTVTMHPFMGEPVACPIVEIDERNVVLSIPPKNERTMYVARRNVRLVDYVYQALEDDIRHGRPRERAKPKPTTVRRVYHGDDFWVVVNNAVVLLYYHDEIAVHADLDRLLVRALAAAGVSATTTNVDLTEVIDAVGAAVEADFPSFINEGQCLDWLLAHAPEVLDGKPLTILPTPESWSAWVTTDTDPLPATIPLATEITGVIAKETTHA